MNFSVSFETVASCGMYTPVRLDVSRYEGENHPRGPADAAAHDAP